jgi:predicted amidophosphoribosyltransferase
VIIDHKERGRLALAAPLGDALAIAVTAVLEAGFGCGRCGRRPVALIPAPSTRAAARARGHDPLVRSTRRAAPVLRRAGQDAAAVPVLSHRRRVADQAGLSHLDREANLHHALAVTPATPALLHGRCVVLVDDIVTSGATMRESVRCLRTAGVQPCGAAVLAKAG